MKLYHICFSLFLLGISSGFAQKNDSNNQLKKEFSRLVSTNPDSAQLILNTLKEKNKGKADFSDDLSLLEGTLIYYTAGSQNAESLIDKALAGADKSGDKT